MDTTSVYIKVHMNKELNLMKFDFINYATFSIDNLQNISAK